MKKRSGFTLLEILLVVAIIAVLAGIVILAINPTKQLWVSRDADRRASINTILSAVHQYSIDNSMNPATLTTTQTEICRTDAVDCTGLIDLSVLTDSSVYLISIPIDPTWATTNGSGYDIIESANGRISVYAPNAEINTPIYVTR